MVFLNTEYSSDLTFDNALQQPPPPAPLVTQWVQMKIVEVVIYSCIYRVAKRHWMPYLYRSFPAKWPYNQWLVAEKDLQLKACYVSSPFGSKHSTELTFEDALQHSRLHCDSLCSGRNSQKSAHYSIPIVNK